MRLRTWALASDALYLIPASSEFGFHEPILPCLWLTMTTSRKIIFKMHICVIVSPPFFNGKQQDVYFTCTCTYTWRLVTNTSLVFAWFRDYERKNEARNFLVSVLGVPQVAPTIALEHETTGWGMAAQNNIFLKLKLISVDKTSIRIKLCHIVLTMFSVETNC